MRVDVTPLGATSRPVAAVARAVVDYLEGPSAAPGPALLTPSGGDAGVAGYFGDSAEGPGRWVGAGDAHHGLVGTVERDAFQRLLEGRHPVTGARLVTARGSSQRGHLAVGAVARFDEHGDPVYDLADTAALLGVAGDDVTAMVAAWTPDSDPGDPAGAAHEHDRRRGVRPGCRDRTPPRTRRRPTGGATDPRRRPP